MEANDQTNEKLTSLKSIVESISPKRVISLKEQIACKQDELEKWKAILDVAEKRTKRFFNSFSGMKYLKKIYFLGFYVSNNIILLHYLFHLNFFMHFYFFSGDLFFLINLFIN
nr:uncharacterized protein LOC124810925 isoform X2 [Hydra vulgaris]